MFDHLESPPKLVVDLGAHCGHFAALCHTCILERFGEDCAEYVLVEAVPKLIPRIERTIREIGLIKQANVIQGVVGKKHGVAYFSHGQNNMLASKAKPEREMQSDQRLEYVDLDAILPSTQAIDVLKIDIEGSEYELVENFQWIVRRSKLLLIETHGSHERRLELKLRLECLGMTLCSKSIERDEESLLLFGNKPLV